MHGKLEDRSVIRVLFVGALGLLGLGLVSGAQDEPQEPLMLIDVEEFTGEVVAVLSADTVEVVWTDTPISVCFAGIDAPELQQTHGTEARRHVEGMLQSRRVRVRLRGLDSPPHCERFGQVLLEGQDISREILEAGWAWLCVESAFPAYVSGLREAERQARESGRGVWMNAEPTPPWVHRGASTCVDGW